MADRYPVRLKRVYELPDQDDGYRVLVDRLWPRGMKREQLAMDRWLKEIAPSTELRKWFGHNPARWIQFCEAYRRELKDPKHRQPFQELLELARLRPITLIYSASDEQHNGARVLKDLLEGASEKEEHAA